MSDPDPDAPDPTPTPSPARTGRHLAMLAIGLGVGLALRLLWAWCLRDKVSEWEADGFVWAWEGRRFDALNRMRAPGAPWLFGRLTEICGATSILAVRVLCVGLSVVALAAAIDLAASVARLTGLTRRSWLMAAAWMSWIWAVHPTLVATAVSPVPETVVGAAGCLLLAGLARRVPGPGVFGFLLAVLGGALLVLTGGSPAALALLIGLLVYLVPVPRLGPALAALVIVAAAGAAGWFVQRGSDPDRPWSLEGAPVHSLLALTSAADRPWTDLPTDCDLRDHETLVELEDRLGEEPGDVALGVVDRLIFEQLGATRFAPQAEALASLATDTPETSVAAGLVLPLGVFDLFLRGGMLLFALTVLGLTRREDGSGWPRAACGVALVAWLVLLGAGAIGPYAVAPFDLVLMGLAGAGVAGGDPLRKATRRVGFVIGGVLLCTLLLTGGWRERPLSLWTTDLTHVHGDGALLVEQLKDGGAHTAPEHARAAALLMQPNAPLLRLPRAALRHATASLEMAPDAPGANEAYVRALVENGRFAEAARLAEELHTAAGRDDVRSKVFLSWVQGEQRRSRDVPVR